MQPKFTLKTFVGLFRKALVVFLLGSSAMVNSQVLSTISGTNYGGDLSVGNTLPLNVSFVIQNTTGSAVALTSMKVQLAPFTGISAAGDALTTKLYMSTTSLSGTYDLATPAWSVVATGAAVVPAVVTYTQVITGANVIIPAGAQYRFAIECTKGLRISGPFAGFPLPTPNTFSSGGLILQVGDFKIGGLNVGWGGLAAPINEPTFFGGEVTLISTLPCSGTPNPGNTMSTVPTVCSGTNFTLSPQNATAGSGVTYKWQTSPNGLAPWTDVPGGTNSSLTTQQNAATYYRVIVTCGANSGTSTPLQVLLTPLSGCYCAAGGTSALDEKISNVTYGSINNSSSATTPYSNYTATQSTNVVLGEVSPITVSLSNGFGSDQVLVWIDFNQDGDWVDAGEQVYTSLQGVGPHSGNITIPATATLGSTRMRVRLHDAVFGPLANPCGTAAYGEVEDYTINIQPCVQGVFTSAPANSTIQCSGNTSFTVAATGSSLSYSWQYRVNSSSAWLTVPNAAPYSTVNTSTLTLTNVPGTYNGYQYRALMQGPCTAVDFSSPPATLTVSPLVATVNPTSATICTGTIQQLSLTNASSPTSVTFTNNTPLAIPDGTPAGVYSTIAVAGIPAGAIVTNVSLKLNITHSFVGDLEINLIAPNNVSMNLIGELDGGTGSNGTDNFVNTVISSSSATPMSGAAAPRTGTFGADRLSGYGPSGNYQTSPNGMPWSDLYTTLNGNWRLGLSDWYNLDAGTLNDWSITITYGAPAAGVWTASPAAPNTMFTNALATIPYVAGTPVTTIWVNPTVNTNYSVVYSTATPCTSAPTVIPVTVVLPVGVVTNPTNKSACVGNNATFTVSATGGPLTYQWQVSSDGGLTWGNISGATASTLTLTSVTSSMNGYRYRAVITAAPCAGSTNSGPATLTVNPLPTVTISSADLSLTPGQTTTISGTSSPAAAAGGWSWTLDGSAIPGTTNSQVAGIDALGVYQARVVDVNGCIGFSNNLTIGAEASDRLWIYPNPSSGKFQVRLYYGGPVTEKRVVRIFKSNGQLVMEKEFTLDNIVSPYLRMDFDLNHLAGGTYVVKVDNTVTGKITSGLVIIQHD